MMKHLVKKLVTEESGQDLIEYCLLAALVGLGSVVTMSHLASAISNTFGVVGNAMSSSVCGVDVVCGSPH